MTYLRKALTPIVAAAVMATSPALAGGGALSPGKPAGVQQAQRHGPSLLLVGGAALVTVIAVVVATQSSNSATCSPTNCPTSTSTATST